MFGKTELEQLQRRKELLARQCDAHRLVLLAEWQRLRSLEFWRVEAVAAARRHPLWTTVLGLGAGLLAVRVVRRPGAALSRLGRWSGAASALLSLWKLFQRQ